MSALYSEAFDHLRDPSLENEDDDYSYQDPELVEACSSFRRSSGAGQSGAFRRKPQSVNERSAVDDMGQDQSSARYIDVLDSEPRRHGLTRSQQSMQENGPVLQGGHHNEDSTEYCYAHSVEKMPTRRPHPPAQLRAVSLRDDYSQPHDRLSSVESTQDYTEPYQTKDNCHSTKVTSPDAGGIYSLAKEVNELRNEDNYNRLNDRINQSHDHRERYDHIASWSSQIPTSASSAKQSSTVAPPPVRKCSSGSDDVFTCPTSVNKMHQEVYRDIPANYEEPWDSQEGQKKFSRLITRAEKTHEKQQSVDQPSGGACKIVGSEPKNSQTKPSGYKEETTLDYEMAWEGKSRKEPPSNPPHPKSHKVLLSNYEDAWDLPEKQKQFEEKLLAARKQRVSHGHIREDDVPSGQTAQPKSPENPNMRRLPSSSSQVMRSDSCRSLGALAEKIDASLPLEEQMFYHGSIKRSLAEKTLLVFKEGSYLVRKSETSKKDYSLTLKGWNGVPMHMKIACKPDGSYVLGENSPPFKTIPDMVNYYTTHELPVQNADRICLLYPIPS